VLAYDNKAYNIVGLKNVNGALLNPTTGDDRDVTDFELDLGTEIIAVVPQPVVRVGASLAQSRNTVEVLLTFIPVKFVHPLRVTDWREITIPMTVLWAAMSLSLVLSAKNRDDWGHIERIELWAWIIASVYFATISLWRTFLKRAEDEPAPDASQT